MKHTLLSRIGVLMYGVLMAKPQPSADSALCWPTAGSFDDDVEN